jgi:hypothetical protein
MTIPARPMPGLSLTLTICASSTAQICGQEAIHTGNVKVQSFRKALPDKGTRKRQASTVDTLLELFHLMKHLPMFGNMFSMMGECTLPDETLFV